MITWAIAWMTVRLKVTNIGIHLIIAMVCDCIWLSNLASIAKVFHV